jgi:acetyltransferase-like isoleucine patch superfamily enzyme
MIHPTAIVSSSAILGSNVSIGAFSIIHDNVEIGDDSKIDNYCEIGYPTSLANSNKLIIGNNSVIRSHSVFYMGSIFGESLVTGHRVTVRENVIAGKNLQIGTLSDIQGDCFFGDYVRLHSNVHVGKKSVVEDFVWLFPYVVLTNDPHPPSNTMMGVTIKAYSVIATMTVLLPGVTVHEHCLIGAHSLVSKDIAKGSVAVGNPAKVITEAASIKLKGSDQAAYPWTAHFHRGYPDDVVAAWLNQGNQDK